MIFKQPLISHKYELQQEKWTLWKASPGIRGAPPRPPHPTRLASGRHGRDDSGLAAMIPAGTWSLTRDDPSRGRTAADVYARREFGGPNAGWLLSISDRHGSMTEPESEALSGDGSFRR